MQHIKYYTICASHWMILMARRFVDDDGYDECFRWLWCTWNQRSINELVYVRICCKFLLAICDHWQFEWMQNMLQMFTFCCVLQIIIPVVSVCVSKPTFGECTLYGLIFHMQLTLYILDSRFYLILVHDDFFLGLLFKRSHTKITFLRNVWELCPDYIVSLCNLV